MTLLERVGAWRDRLRAAVPPRGRLSEAGAATVWAEALDAVSDEALRAATASPGAPWPSVGMACPRTVPTAPLEWCAVALARGSRVVLKVPADDPAPGAFLAGAAATLGLPLEATTDRGALVEVALAVVMGSDETVAAVRAARHGRPVLAFGDRFSIAWVTDVASAAAVAEDAARFDGRGCLSPVTVFTPIPPATLTEALGVAMAEAEARWPRGAPTAAEGAGLRTRLARARVSGGPVRTGPTWSVVPAERTGARGLPRSLGVAHAPTFEGALERLGADAPRLSTVGSDAPVVAPPGVRVTPLGTMQRPPLLRLHDGVDWVAALVRADPAAVGRRD